MRMRVGLLLLFILTVIIAGCASSNGTPASDNTTSETVTLR